MAEPDRGFPEAEYRDRLARAQTRMKEEGLNALLLTTDADIRYFTGFLTRFWESPTRPWFVVLPASGKPIAVIPSIGAALMAKTWVDDIRTWQAPSLVDDGVSLLADTIRELCGQNGRVGVPMALESHLRMPLADWALLQNHLIGIGFMSDGGIVSDLRMIKSEHEIRRIQAACDVANRAFARVPEIASKGVPLDQVFRRFQMLCLEEGADWVAYLAGGAGQGGYDDVISPADTSALQAGDVLMLDTGVILDGYFCDFDRNFSVGRPDPIIRDAHFTLVDAVNTAMEVARPGARAADLFHEMDKIVSGVQSGEEAGRLGHGLGLQLTEGLSITPADQTVLKAGMVLTLEPVIGLPNQKILVHEENIVIRETGAEFLSAPASPDIQVIEG